MSTSASEPTVVSFGEDVLERMVQAVAAVEARLRRATAALEGAGISYALGGSNATAAWIASVDESAVRNARNVEVLLFRSDLQQAKQVLKDVGFFPAIRNGQVRLLDGQEGRWREGIEITFGGERVSEKSSLLVAPLPSDSEIIRNCRVLRLIPLVEFQLARFRLDDAVDLRDMIEVGLLDQSWVGRLPSELAERLQQLLDNPDG